MGEAKCWRGNVLLPSGFRASLAFEAAYGPEPDRPVSSREHWKADTQLTATVQFPSRMVRWRTCRGPCQKTYLTRRIIAREIVQSGSIELHFWKQQGIMELPQFLVEFSDPVFVSDHRSRVGLGQFLKCALHE